MQQWRRLTNNMRVCVGEGGRQSLSNMTVISNITQGFRLCHYAIMLSSISTYFKRLGLNCHYSGSVFHLDMSVNFPARYGAFLSLLLSCPYHITYFVTDYIDVFVLEIGSLLLLHRAAQMCHLCRAR